ncbi:helix-turn-helix transcriptional regulator [Clostridium sp. AN503]|jgi:transcriptional regulator with XRE-family HTH domain|uniref:helix-turn-helix domain-containing protein n=1 Tax=Clostridium sp. AN503 TaxID=3160598 RepID=UPI003457FCF4
MELYNRIAVGERIRKRRILLGLTQEELAEKVGRAYKYCQDIERGTCGMSIDTLLKLSSSLNISLDYLIYGYQDDYSARTPEMLQTQETVLNMLGTCSEQKRRYALDLLKLFLKACDDR